jgi:hypothetical protein
MVVSGIVSACGGSGPSESEFVQACLIEGGADEESCLCGAREAKSILSADAYKAMVLEMRGDKREAAEITAAMTEEQQMKFIMQTGEIFDKCFLTD